MLETLQVWDLTILHAVNEGWASPGADAFFRFVTHEKNFLLPAVLLLLLACFRGGTKGRWLAAALLLNVLLTDQLSSHVIKPLVQRPRPCQAYGDLRTPDGCGPAYSFPSSHAANSGGIATLISFAYPAWAPWAALGALLVGISRVYLGVHYPSDVAAGFLLGFLCGFAVWRLKARAQEAWFRMRPRREKKP